MKVFQILGHESDIKIEEGIEVSYSEEGTKTYLNKRFIPIRLLEYKPNVQTQKKVYNVKLKESEEILLLEEISPLKEKNHGNVLLFVKDPGVVGIICDRSFYRQKILLTDYEKENSLEKKCFLLRLKSDTPIKLLKTPGIIYELLYDPHKQKFNITKKTISDFFDIKKHHEPKKKIS